MYHRFLVPVANIGTQSMINTWRRRWHCHQLSQLIQSIVQLPTCVQQKKQLKADCSFFG